MQGIAATASASVELISTFTATNQAIPAVVSEPGWYVIGTLFLPIGVTGVQLEAIGALSVAGLTMNVRLFDLVAVAPVGGSDTTALTAIPDTRSTSGLFDLTGGRQYQIQVQVIGTVDPANFGTIKSAQLIGGA